MSSILFITSVDNLQHTINEVLRGCQTVPCIYVSLNKTQKSTEEILKNNGVDTSKIFFIDCVTSDKTREDVMHVAPDKLDILLDAIKAFCNEIKSEKILVIDAISTLLIYNDENKVAMFTKAVTELASRDDVETVAFTPETKGENLLNRIYNFFDTVDKR